MRKYGLQYIYLNTLSSYNGSLAFTSAVPYVSNYSLEIFPYKALGPRPTDPLPNSVDSSALLFEAQGKYFYMFPKDVNGQVFRDEYIEWITLGAFSDDVALSTPFLGFGPVTKIRDDFYSLIGDFGNGMHMNLTVTVHKLINGRDTIKIGWTITNPSFSADGPWQLALVINSRTPLSENEITCFKGSSAPLESIAQLAALEPVPLFNCSSELMALSSSIFIDLNNLGSFFIDFVYQTRRFNVTFVWAGFGKLDDTLAVVVLGGMRSVVAADKHRTYGARNR
jgi:hypothetical protein